MTTAQASEQINLRCEDDDNGDGNDGINSNSN